MTKSKEKQKIIVILGPTASGKSDLAVQVAKKYNGEIISADSRQVYKGLNIGTGKITKREMRGVPHHLLDVANPILRRGSGQGKQFSAAHYKKLGEKAIEKILDKNKIPIICGGTGLYIDVLLGNINFPEVPPNEKLRKKLEKKSAPELFKILLKLDKARAQSIDRNNPRRLIRAIEIASELGKVPKQVTSDKLTVNNKYEAIKIGIRIPDEELRERINKRIDKWFRQGLVKEVENLHKHGLSWKRMAEIGLEYKLVAKFLKGEIDKEEMVKRMQIENWQYAKRQMTWFKRPARTTDGVQSGGDKEIKWIAPRLDLALKVIGEI